MQVKRRAGRGIVHRGLLVKACDLYSKQFGLSLMDAHEDENGVYAYSNKYHVVCAKREAYFDQFGTMIVSVHEDAIIMAQKWRQKIMMYVKDKDSFVEFDPDEIINAESSTINERDGARMINFLYNLGRTPDQIPMFVMKEKIVIEREVVASPEAARRGLDEARAIVNAAVKARKKSWQ